MKKDKILKRFLAFVLSAAMVLTYMPTSMIAFAGDEAAEAASSEPKAAAAEEVKSEPAPAPKAEEPAPAPKAEEPAPAPAAEEPAPAPAEESAPAPAESEEAAPASEENADAAAEESAPADETAEVTDEQAAEDLEEEEDEELEYPAQNFSGSANGVSVSVSAPEGALPEGTTMNVSAVSAASVQSAVENAIGTEAAKIKAVDITFRHEGKDIEPKKAVKVHMNASGMATEGNQSVVHIADNGSANVVTQNVNNGSATFKSGEFSIYVVVEEGQTEDDSRLKVNFHQADNNVVTMMITKNQLSHIEQYIYDPGTGTLPDGAEFKGWTTEENYTKDSVNKALTISDIRSSVEAKLNEGVAEGAAVDYYAMAFKSYTVTYLDEEGVTIKNDQLLYPATDASSHSYTVNLAYTPYVKPEYEQYGTTAEFKGWEDEDETLHQNGSAIDVSSNITLKAIVEVGYWLTFSDNLRGASYTPPVFVKDGETPTEPSEVPTRAGYSFIGWYTEDANPDARDGKAAGSAFDFNTPLSKTTTVYGNWQENTSADYNVVIWKQNTSGDGYDYAETVHVTNATVGENTYPVSARGNGARIYDGDGNRDYDDYSYNGFHLSTTKGTSGSGYDSPVAVAAENNTVINVYFDRNTITYNFRYSNSRTETFSGLYGAPFAEWPDPGTGHVWKYGSGMSAVYFPLPLTEFKPENIRAGTTDTEFTFTLGDMDHVSTLTVYKQDVDGTWKYDDEHIISTAPLSGNAWTPSETYTGFELDSYSLGDTSNWTATTPTTAIHYSYREWGWTYYYDLNLRYKRNTHDINYVDGVYGKIVGGEYAPIDETKLPDDSFTNATDIRYEADISDKGDYTPTRDGYVFLGWYADEGCNAKYDFDTMPDHNVTVYAKWVASEVAVELVPNDSKDDPIQYADSEQPSTFRVDYGEKIGNPGAARENYDLVGWYADPDFKKAFDFDVFTLNDTTLASYGDPSYKEEGRQSVVGKITLYAKWRSKLDGSRGIEVEYDPANGNDPYTDGHFYADQAEAVTGGAAESSDPEKVFSHWVVQKWNGSEYEPTSEKVFPGDTFTVKKSAAKEEAFSDPDYPSVDKRFIVRLVAEYIEKDKEVKTHINWYDNFGGTVREDKDLKINQDVPVPAAPTHAGYTFKGWVRDVENTSTKKTDSKELFIKYEGGKYDHTKVAADENWAAEDNQYHAMYALWEAEEVVYKVEFYYQNDNSEGYTKDDSLGYTDKALTGSTVTVKDADKNQTKNGKYELVTGAPSVLSATVSGDGTTTLKLYFNINTADVTVHHYLRGTTVKVANDVTETKPIGSKYTADTTSTYQGKTLSVDASASDNYTDVDVAAGGTVIYIYYAIPLTVAVVDKTAVYNGSEQKGYGVSATEKDDKGNPAVTADNLLEGDSIGELNYTPANGTDAGEYTNGAFTKDPAITNGEGKNAGYYNITKTPGKLTITKAPGNTVEPGKDPEDDAEKVESGNVTVVYDGKSHTVKATATKAGSTVYYSTDNGETWTTEAPVRTEAGTTEYKIKATNPNYQDATNDTVYKLTVTKRPVNVVVNNAPDATYDGQEHSGLTEYKFDNVVSGQTASITYTPAKGTNAGDYTGSYSADTFAVKAGDEDVTANYELKNETPGKLKINRAEVTITTGSGSKTYDGSALTNSEAGITGLVPADEGKVKVTAKGSQTEIGSSKNDYDIDWGDVDQKNYKITANLGTLTVNAPTPTPPTPPTPDPDPTPTPTPTPGGGGGNPGGGTPAVVPAAVTPAPAVIDDTPAPQAEPEEIDDEPAPAAAPEGAWALINLICAALATVGAVVALLRKKEDDDEDEDEAAKKPEDEDEKDNRGRNMAIAKVLGVAAAAASVITFILTEDMSLPMVMTDKWTLLMAVLFAAQIGTAVANKKAAESDDEDEEGAEA